MRGSGKRSRTAPTTRWMVSGVAQPMVSARLSSVMVTSSSAAMRIRLPTASSTLATEISPS